MYATLLGSVLKQSRDLEAVNYCPANIATSNSHSFYLSFYSNWAMEGIGVAVVYSNKWETTEGHWTEESHSGNTVISLLRSVIQVPPQPLPVGVSSY